MADAVTTFTTLSTDAQNVWIARETYKRLERNLVIGRYAKKYTLPQRMGKTVRTIRHSRLNLPVSTLTEGTPPDAIALALENVDVTVEQWGIVVSISDIGMITTQHPALNEAIELTGEAMSELLEREQAVMLMAGTNAYFPGTATSRATLGAADKLDTATILKATTALRTKGAPAAEGGLYNGVMAPNQEGDVLSSDQTFKDSSNFANVRKLDYGEIGIWMGTRWGRGNFLPVFAGVAAPASGAAAAAVAGHNMSGSGGAIDSSKITVVSIDVSSGYERKISQELTVADADGTFALTTPTSANYVYDLYMTDTAGANYKRVATRVAANTATTINAALYTAGAAKTPIAAPAAGREVFVAWVFGRDSFGRVELNGMSLESFITPAGASDSNPLAQRRKVGSKIMWKSFIQDNDKFNRIETASAYSALLPT